MSMLRSDAREVVRELVKAVAEREEDLHAKILKASGIKQFHHPDFGPATITKIKKDGTVWIKLHNGGTEGTTSAEFIRKFGQKL
jgi:hypothetical protein